MIKKAVLVSKNAVDIAEKLESDGFEVIRTPENPNVDKKISDHTDISFFFDGNDTVFIAKEASNTVDKIKAHCKSIIILDECMGNNYPDDVSLNCVVIGDKLICNTGTVSKKILEHMSGKGYSIIDVKQGYTKCSVLPVTENALITDDVSVYEKCRACNMDVLLIEKGDILLKGYPYGFVGGASGRLAHDKIYFNGDISLHRDYERIRDFLCKYSVEFCCTNNVLTDIGSILPLYKI